MPGLDSISPDGSSRSHREDHDHSCSVRCVRLNARNLVFVEWVESKYAIRRLPRQEQGRVYTRREAVRTPWYDSRSSGSQASHGINK